MSNSYKEYASKEYVHSVVISKENIEQMVADSLVEAKAYTDERVENGVRSWNDLTDKPFGETSEVVTEEMIVEWDGIVGDRTVVDIGAAVQEVLGVPGAVFVHVSDAVVPDAGSAVGGVIEYNQSGTTKEQVIDENGVFDADGLISLQMVYVASVPQDGFVATQGLVEGTVFPKKGLYFLTIPEMATVTKYTGILTGLKTVVKKLDKKFLPEHAHSWNSIEDKPFGETEEEYTEEVTEPATVEWDGVIGDKEFIVLNESAIYVHVSDAIIPSLEGAGNVTLGAMAEGAFQEMAVPSNAMMEDDGVILVNQFAISVDEDNKQYTGGIGNPFAGIVFPKKGLYFLYAQGGTQYISKLTCVFTQSLSSTRTVVKKIDEKYLPDTVATKADIQSYIDNALLKGAW